MMNKIFSFINIFGLTVGLTSFLLIALYVFDELTFDRFHKNADTIYRIVEDKTTPEGKETKIAGVAYQVSEQSKKDFPEIKDAVRLTAFGRANVSNPENTNIFYEDFLVGNEGFLTTFDFPLLYGNRKTALTATHSVIVTEETAKKLFNTADVMDKAIKVDRDSIPFKITGVLKNFPINSHLSFNILFSEPSMSSEDFQKFINADWSSNFFTTYLLLDKKADPHKLETKLNKFVALNKKNDDKTKSNFILQPLKDIHFYSNDIEGEEGGNITFIYVFCIVAIFVLLIACINYMNLTTARFANRSKEIAIRKVTGASRKNLAGQFLSEAFLVTFISLVLALLLVKFLLPSFNSFTEKQLTLGAGTDYRIWIGIAAIIIIVSLLSGIYPALFQSRLKPLQLFKNKINTGKGNLSIRRSLVVFQFAISIIMIVATMVVYMQLKYINTKNMGFNKEQMLVVDINSGAVRRSAETIKTEFAKLPQVKYVSVSSRVPGEWKDLPKVKVRNEKIQIAKGSDMYFLGVDDQFLKTYQITLVKGKNFTTGSLADSSSVIINETAAKQLGITEPLGQQIEIPSVDFDGEIAPLDKPYAAEVVGIVKDFNFKSLREPAAAMVLGFKNNPVQNIDYFTVKVTTIAVLTIVIACLGLFGLATYAAEQRIKEIGIHKVLGASVSSIVTMLSKDFLTLVMIAAIIAFPVAWWAMHLWLEDFAYRINISWWVFIVAGLIALMISLIAISFQAIKAAIANPVKSLRTE